jgi:4-hydroxy-tetrahydrodipicolinate synthase
METTGCGTAIVTPFTADGALDEAALRALVKWQIDSGIDFIVACGSTGEAATLDEEEWLAAVNVVAETAAGRVPVWAGCTHNSTRTLVRLAGRLRDLRGVNAVLSANPYYNKPSQEGQFQHFQALAQAVDPLPVTLYNIPGRTGVNLEPETVLRLAEAAPNIQAIKESSGKLPQISDLVHILPRGFKIFSGELERRYARLIDANFWDSNPTPVKTVLSLMGRCSHHVRLPLVPPPAATRGRLERLAAELGLLAPVRTM